MFKFLLYENDKGQLETLPDLSKWTVNVGFGEQIYLEHKDCEEGFDYLRNDTPTVEEVIKLIQEHKCDENS